MKGGVSISMLPKKPQSNLAQNQQSGFTIIELMIATLVFTLILIVITTGIMSFTRQYYRGVIATKTQGTARAIVDDITRAIQFNGGEVVEINGPIGSPSKGYCVGSSKRYSILLRKQVTDDGALGPNQSRHALVSDNDAGCNVGTEALAVESLGSLSGLDNGREQLGENMRLANFAIDEVDGYYTITARVVYGDDDLLCSPTVAGDCSSDGLSPYLDAPNLTCKVAVGSQFCAAAELSTTVTKRVN